MSAGCTDASISAKAGVRAAAMQREDVDPSPSTDGGKEDTSVEGTSAAGVGTAAVCSPLEEFIQVTSPPLFD